MVSKPRKLLFGLKLEFHFNLAVWGFPLFVSYLYQPGFRSEAATRSVCVNILCFGFSIFS